MDVKFARAVLEGHPGVNGALVTENRFGQLEVGQQAFRLLGFVSEWPGSG